MRKKMADISEQELGEVYAFAVQLGKDAGSLLMQAVQQRIVGNPSVSSPAEVQYVQKENSVDIVTKTDNGISSSVPNDRSISI